MKKNLTPGEICVLKELMVDGASNKLIAQRLGVGEWTVKIHLRHALAKMQMPPGLHNRTAMVLYFQKHPHLLIQSDFAEL